ncbi:hypothetical protein MUA48_08085 [Staphylococcus sp. IVB6238]|uniref:hypothetical protein n=1 Tax=Staphylococcus sp. IVB6238 TaxID=2989770 RepID=UPI0021CE2F3F|nr:hypothetical protein [Staphylococcus sp. IVB6238]UXR73329.1 hypothetical protein MUA48_08085 [Staphylococcus sp. IVB6238]
MELFQSVLFSNVIALLAFAASIYSIIYTRSQNKFHFAITDMSVDKKDGYIEFSFAVVNSSPKSQFLKDLIFLDENLNVMKHIEIGPFESSDLFSNLSDHLLIDGQLEKPELILPNNFERFTYNFYTVPKYVKIVSNERIDKFRKYVLVSTDSYKCY